MAPGFEAEHHERALSYLRGVKFRIDVQAKRVGILTTNPIKHASCQLLNVLLRENRVQVIPELISRNPEQMRVKLRDQLEIFSYQFKTAETVFQTDRCALSGKVGGQKPPKFELTQCTNIQFFDRYER